MKYKTRFLLFFVAMALFHLASNFAHPVTPTIIQELGLSDYMFGLMLAVMMIANFALSPSWGNINRFISSRQSLLICCVGYALAQLGFAYSTTQAGILFVRLLAGVFIGGVFVSMLTYVVNVARPEDMAKYLTYSATLHSVFGAFGYLIGGAVVIEVIFNLPGMGMAILSGIQSNYVMLIQGVVLVVAITFIIINIIVDMLYILIDPRIRTV